MHLVEHPLIINHSFILNIAVNVGAMIEVDPILKPTLNFFFAVNAHGFNDFA